MDERIGDAEAQKLNDSLHKLARQIVEDAEKQNAVIIVGDLGEIRKDNDKKQYVNDKTHKMSFAHLLDYIEYKTHDADINVQLVASTTRQKRVIAVPARVSVRRRNGLSAPSVSYTATWTRTMR